MTTTYKILMLVENLPVPADPRVWAEARTLRDHGFQVSIICPKGDSRHRESYICIDNIHIYRYQLRRTTNKYTSYIAEYAASIFMTFWLSFTVLFHHGFDVIHAANPPDLFFLIGLFYRLFGKKFLFDQHDLMPEIFRAMCKDRMKLLYKLLLSLEKWTYRTADLAIVANESFKQIAIKRSGCPADKVFVVRNGPNLEHMKLVTPEAELKGGRRYLLAYVGVMAMQV